MHATRRLILLASASALAACATARNQVAVAPPHEAAPALAVVAEPAPVSALVQQVAIPHEGFRLEGICPVELCRPPLRGVGTALGEVDRRRRGLCPQ